jgi:hypothetical protein
MKKAPVKDFMKNPIGGHKTRKYLNYLEIAITLFKKNSLFLSGHRPSIVLFLSTIRHGRNRKARIITLNSRHLDSLVES